MSIRRLLAAGLLVAVLGACEGPSADGELGAEREDTPAATPTEGGPQNRAPTEVRVDNLATGPSHARVATAVRDLKRIGLWDDLSAHLFVIEIQSRAGREDIPDDKHLADAFLSGTIEAGGSGGFCSIMFFPTAISVDLRQWRSYYEQGLHPEEPPTMRQFWTSILGHELGHCFKGQPGEDVAEHWEAKVLEALRKANIE
jgi:hypothetical protein